MLTFECLVFYEMRFILSSMKEAFAETTIEFLFINFRSFQISQTVYSIEFIYRVENQIMKSFFDIIAARSILELLYRNTHIASICNPIFIFYLFSYTTF